MQKREDINRIVYVDYLPVKRLMAINTFKGVIKNYSKKNIYRSPFSYAVELKKDKFYLYSTILSVISWSKLYSELNKIVKKIKLENVILWSYYPLNVDYFDFIENKCKVIYLDDDWKRFKHLQQKTSIDYIDVLRKNYNSISNKADFIFTASDELLEIFMGHDNSYWIDDVHSNSLENFNWEELVNDMFNKINNR